MSGKEGLGACPRRAAAAQNGIPVSGVVAALRPRTLSDRLLVGRPSARACVSAGSPSDRRFPDCAGEGEQGGISKVARLSGVAG